MEHEKHTFPAGLLPIPVAIRACLLGAPTEAVYEASPKRPLDCDPDEPADIDSLSNQLAAALEREPPGPSSLQQTETTPAAPQDGGLPPSSPTSAPDGAHPASSSLVSSSRLYPPLPAQSTSGSGPETAWSPSSTKPEAPLEPSCPLPDVAASPSGPVPGRVLPPFCCCPEAAKPPFSHPCSAYPLPPPYVSTKQPTKLAQLLQDSNETFPAFVVRVLEACQ
ncbi:uncharacterized protein [Dasypus novemcinctus]|uniref:uncharacterized protein n=1 Tax=Dasypus novemcinctus TaxID=9361 RepID=UPI0039C9B86F